MGAVSERGTVDPRFIAAREWVLRDYEEALTRDRVRAIPTIIVNGGKRLVGLVDSGEYRRVVESG